jgi:hypothetical protein
MGSAGVSILTNVVTGSAFFCNERRACEDGDAGAGFLRDGQEFVVLGGAQILGLLTVVLRRGAAGMVCVVLGPFICISLSMFEFLSV